MAIAVDRIHQQFNKQNVIDFDVVEESRDFLKPPLTHVPRVPKNVSKELQKLSLTDMPPQPPVPNTGKQLEQKPAGDFLYENITKCLAPDTYSPYLACYDSLQEPEWMRHEKPKLVSTYSPYDLPDWIHKWDFELPETYEEYVALKTSGVPSFIASFISDE